jgi:hypothetical protein
MACDLVTAKPIAMLCYGLPIDEAADLIEQYARVSASQARYNAAAEAYEHMLSVVNPEKLAVPNA